MNREFASKGYKVVADTTPVTSTPFFAFQVIAEATLTSITAPSGQGPENIAYNGDEAGLAGHALPAGAVFMCRGSGIELASGKVIIYFE
jgi:hypothetical protein